MVVLVNALRPDRKKLITHINEIRLPNKSGMKKVINNEELEEE